MKSGLHFEHFFGSSVQAKQPVLSSGWQTQVVNTFFVSFGSTEFVILKPALHVKQTSGLSLQISQDASVGMHTQTP
jgi:hypothetical protein